MGHATIRPLDILHTITEHPRRVFLPLIVVTLAALGYAWFKPTLWEASQALVVRDETGDRSNRPGKFALADEMKTSQETLLELAKSRGVVQKALTEVGPPVSYNGSKAWPTEDAVEQLQGRVKLTPPKGAEFGKTEVFYLKVQDENRARAVELASAICHQLQQRVGLLRETTAQSTIDELTRSRSVAQADLDEVTGLLTAMEKKVGNDLAELRILSESPSGESDLRRNAVELEKELRSYQATQAENEELLKALQAAEADPKQLLASPSILLKSQPALGRLKDGLVDAQLRSSQALGTMSEDHPLVQGARETEKAVRQQLHNEIAQAIDGVQVDLRVNAERIAALKAQAQSIQDRLNKLVSLRAEYSNLVNSSRNRSETLKSVEHDLSEARASQASARTSSRLTPVDSPVVGSGPIGPSRASLAALGLFGGLLASAAVIFLSINPGVVRQASAPADRVKSTTPATAGTSGTTKVSLSIKQAIERVAANGV